MLKTSKGDKCRAGDAIQNCWMILFAMFVLSMIKPTYYGGKKAPGLYTPLGEVLHKLGDWDDLHLHLLCGKNQHQAAWHSPAKSQDLLLLLAKSNGAYTHVDKK